MSIENDLMQRVRDLLLEDLPLRDPCEHQLQFWVDKRDVDITGHVTTVTGVFIEDVYCQLPGSTEHEVYVTVHIVAMDAVDGKVDEEDIRQASFPAKELDRAVGLLYTFSEGLEQGLEPCDMDLRDDVIPDEEDGDGEVHF
jgi:hypothetical protein